MVEYLVNFVILRKVSVDHLGECVWVVPYTVFLLVLLPVFHFVGWFILHFLALLGSCVMWCEIGLSHLICWRVDI